MSHPSNPGINKHLINPGEIRVCIKSLDEESIKIYHSCDYIVVDNTKK